MTPHAEARAVPADPHGPWGSRGPPSLGIRKQLLEVGTLGFEHKTLLEVAQSRKCLPHKHKDPTSLPKPTLNGLAQWHMLINPEIETGG